MALSSADNKEIKMVLVGSSYTAKTKIVCAFTEDTSASFISTIGVDFKQRFLNVNGNTYNVRLWDTAGQERFRTITESYLSGAQATIVVVDFSHSRDEIKHTIEWLRSLKKRDASMHLLVVANKPENKGEAEAFYNMISEVRADKPCHDDSLTPDDLELFKSDVKGVHLVPDFKPELIESMITQMVADHLKSIPVVDSEREVTPASPPSFFSRIFSSFSSDKKTDSTSNTTTGTKGTVVRPTSAGTAVSSLPLAGAGRAASSTDLPLRENTSRSMPVPLAPPAEISSGISNTGLTFGSVSASDQDEDPSPLLS